MSKLFVDYLYVYLLVQNMIVFLDKKVNEPSYRK